MNVLAQGFIDKPLRFTGQKPNRRRVVLFTILFDKEATIKRAKKARPNRNAAPESPSLNQSFARLASSRAGDTDVGERLHRLPRKGIDASPLIVLCFPVETADYLV